MNKLIAEACGAAILVMIGCGAVAIGGFGGSWPLGILPVALAFGLAVTAMAYAIGPVSGCHINPAVTLGMVVAGRMTLSQGVQYMVAQIAGAIIGAALLYFILSGKIGGYDLARNGLGQTGWGPAYLGGFGLMSALLAEIVATFIFVSVILSATSEKGAGALAGLVIGLTLTAMILAFVNVTGASLNPARSFGPALIVGGEALQQVWLFFVGPLIGGALAGIASKAGVIGR
jgi:aquaporin Z